MRSISIKRLLGAWLWLIPILLSLVSIWLSHILPVIWLDHRIADTYFRVRGTRADSEKFVIVGMDDATFNKAYISSAYWGWYHAEVIRKLASTGAKAIALDIFAPERPDMSALGIVGEEEARELEFASYRSMGAAIAEARFTHDCPVFLATYLRHNKVEMPRDELLEGAGGGHETLGFINLFADEAGDSVIREFGVLLPAKYQAGMILPSLPYLAAHYALTGEHDLKGSNFDSPVSVQINYIGPAGTFPHLSYSTILRASSDELEALREQWQDRVVFIGTWEQPSDSYVTPYSDPLGMRRMSGVEIVANVADTIYLGRKLENLLPIILSVVAAAFLLFSTLVIVKLSHSLSLASDIALAVALYWGGFLAFRADYLVSTGTLILLLVINSFAVRLYRYALVEREGRRVAAYFSRYVNPQALSSIVDERVDSLLAGERYEVAVLFVDIRGFTTMSEKLPPDDVITFLTQYHDEMAEIVSRYNGWVDKFIGDGAMVLFGYPAGRQDAADRAILCAREMIKVASVIERPDALGKISIGIGLHYGSVVVGNVGSKAKLDFTAVGDTVNTASRVQELCKEFNTPVVATDDFLVRLREEHAESAIFAGSVQLRGRADSVVYTFRWEETGFNA